VSLVLVAAAVGVVAGGVVAVAARDARVALVGLLAALVLAPLIADPLPGLLPLAARLVAAVLTGELLRITLRSTTSRTRGSVLGWPVESLVAATAFVAGWALVGLVPGALAGPGTESGAATGPVEGPITAPIAGSAGFVGPAAAGAAGSALAALALNAIFLARETFRVGLGLMLLLVGATLVRVMLAGTPGPLEQVVTGGVLVALGAALAFVSGGAYEVAGDFELPERRRPAAVSEPAAANPADASR